MVCDDARHRTVLFGAFSTPQGSSESQTWEYDGVSWTRVATGGPRTPRPPQLACESHRRLTILQGPGTWA